MRKILASISIILAGVGVSGCQSPPEIDVEHQWADAMRRLNMFGFYPMTEDVQVGDIFLNVPPRDGSPSLPRFSLIRVASYRKDLILRELGSQQKGDRLSIQPLPTAAEASSPAVDRTTACDAYDVGHADQEKCQVRLRRSAIPALTVGRVTTAQLGATGLLGNVGARLGLGSSTETAVHIYLSNIQELSLDTWRFSRMQGRGSQSIDRLSWSEDLISSLGQLRPELALPACKGDVAQLQRNRVTVEVINRVVYAGAIEYSFSQNAETAVRLALDLEAAGGLGTPKIPSLPAPPAGAGSPGTNAAPSTDAAGASKAAAGRLAGLLGSLSGETGGTEPRAGITTSFGIGTFGNMALKVKFNRPVAVGAGSKVRYSFFDWANGTGDDNFDDKLRGAARYCRSAFPTELDASALKGLKRAFGCESPVRTKEQTESCQCVDKSFAAGDNHFPECPRIGPS
jgi:hypothetical protein